MSRFFHQWVDDTKKMDLAKVKDGHSLKPNPSAPLSKLITEECPLKGWQLLFVFPFFTMFPFFSGGVSPFKPAADDKSRWHPQQQLPEPYLGLSTAKLPAGENGPISRTQWVLVPAFLVVGAGFPESQVPALEAL